MVKLQLLLRKQWRTPEGVESVRKAAAAIGMTPTASGAASVSAEMDPAAFSKLFGQPVQHLPRRPAGPTDFGTSSGGASGPLKVPAALSDYVESITVAPPHLLL